jgi:hypothetical protein
MRELEKSEEGKGGEVSFSVQSLMNRLVLLSRRAV